MFRVTLRYLSLRLPNWSSVSLLSGLCIHHIGTWTLWTKVSWQYSQSGSKVTSRHFKVPANRVGGHEAKERRSPALSVRDGWLDSERTCSLQAHIASTTQLYGCRFPLPKWEFLKIRGPNINPQIVGLMLF